MAEFDMFRCIIRMTMAYEDGFHDCISTEDLPWLPCFHDFTWCHVAITSWYSLQVSNVKENSSGSLL